MVRVEDFTGKMIAAIEREFEGADVESDTDSLYVTWGSHKFKVRVELEEGGGDTLEQYAAGG